MERIGRLAGMALTVWLFQSCSPMPAPDSVSPGLVTKQIVAERMAAVIVTEGKDLKRWSRGNFSVSTAPEDADGGSAAPISPDGYFMTADHVLSRMGNNRQVFIITGQGSRTLKVLPARVVWRSSGSDLAILHVAWKTPYYYHWSPAEQWVPAGTMVMHGGISTGFKGDSGKLTTSLGPGSPFTGSRSFKIDIPLQPGDSGGPVVDSYGRLIGINSAVEFLVPMETAFFVDSEGNRPNTQKIGRILAKDRGRFLN